MLYIHDIYVYKYIYINIYKIHSYIHTYTHTCIQTHKHTLSSTSVPNKSESVMREAPPSLTPATNHSFYLSSPS